MAGRRAAFEALTRSLGLQTLAPDETVRPGTLVVRSADAHRGDDDDDEHASLPRLDVARDESTAAAELTIGELLGEGGMGAVHVARQRSLRRDVAVKRLRDGPEKTRGVGALLAEARIVGALEHPNVVPVHLLGVDEDGTPILVMKRIEGATLSGLLADADHAMWAELDRRHGDRTTARCEILMRVADGLHFAHSRGYVHRDVKPSNVMIGSFGEVYLVDWGVALAPEGATRGAHEIVGTPAFMAPEMVSADPRRVGPRTDVYLLGATLHYVLTGTVRHRGENAAQVLFAAYVSAPHEYDASVPAELAALASAATSEDPAARPESAAAFRDALADFLRHRGSLRLTEAAEPRIAALRPAGEAAPDPKVLATPETSAILSECRFALTQALREWSENERARRALRTTLLYMVEAELLRRSADGADAIARELDPPEPSLAPRIDALRRELAESEALAKEALAERQERDLAPTSRYRVPLTIAIMLASTALFVRAMLVEAQSARAIPMTRVVPADVAMLGLMSAALWIFRKRMLTNRLSRQLASLLLLSLAASTVADQIHASRGETSTEAGALSIMMIGAVYLGAAIGIGGRLWWAAGVCFAAGVVAAIWTWTATSMVGVGILGCLAALIYDALGPRTGKTSG